MRPRKKLRGKTALAFEKQQVFWNKKSKKWYVLSIRIFHVKEPRNQTIPCIYILNTVTLVLTLGFFMPDKKWIMCSSARCIGDKKGQGLLGEIEEGALCWQG